MEEPMRKLRTYLSTKREVRSETQVTDASLDSTALHLPGQELQFLWTLAESQRIAAEDYHFKLCCCETQKCHLVKACELKCTGATGLPFHMVSKFGQYLLSFSVKALMYQMDV